MSVEEDTELKNLVAQTLENKGILPKIRAELRANVFLALEENPATKETLLKNEELSAFVKIPVGSLILNLIREFLEFFELEFTLSVFDPETKYGKDYCSLAKEKMMKELKITECENKNPLLYEVIERVINRQDLLVLNEKSLGQGNIFENGDTGQLIPSPLPLNSTFIKSKPDVESLPLSPVEKERNKEDENETIKEELTSNCVSDSDSLAELNLNKSPVVENTDDKLLPSNSLKDSVQNSPKAVPKNPEEFDLLIFTPVKESKPKENVKPSSLPVKNETKTNDEKESEKSMSVLGDLPPLTLKSDEKGSKINKIKAIIEKWPGLENDDDSSFESKSSKDAANEEKSPLQSKSDRSEQSQKSSKSSASDDFEEDISDLINGHTHLDGQLTIDETISKASCEADYLESV